MIGNIEEYNMHILYLEACLLRFSSSNKSIQGLVETFAAEMLKHKEKLTYQHYARLT